MKDIKLELGDTLVHDTINNEAMLKPKY